MVVAHPILTCAEAKGFEAVFFAGDEVREWAAMQRAGVAVGEAVLKDFCEIGGFPPEGRVLVLAGTGHNAGDALIAARHIRRLHPQARIEVRFVFGERGLRPLAQRAWRELVPMAKSVSQWSANGYDLVLDGVFGYQFHAPLATEVSELLAEVNSLKIRIRAAIDLPSGLADPSAFRADFTYATGIVKSPLLMLTNAGRLRYINLNFNLQIDTEVRHVSCDKQDRVLTEEVIGSLREVRSAWSDKRTYGHLFIIGGSRSYPGAVLMSVLAALRSGVGLVTAFVPESLVAAFAARAPEAMWVGWPETPDGHLALDGSHLLASREVRASALLIGPGLGLEAETLALIEDVVACSVVPLVIDADALQPKIVCAGTAPRVLTPHASEYARIDGSIPGGAVTIKKGPITTVQAGAVNYHSFFGGPVLARGGSGDILAGLTAGLLAQTPNDRLLAACRGAVWHGMAGDALARVHGQVSVQITQLLDFLPEVLRKEYA